MAAAGPVRGLRCADGHLALDGGEGEGGTAGAGALFEPLIQKITAFVNVIFNILKKDFHYV